MTWKLELSKVSNGYVVKYDDTDDDDGSTKTTEVVYELDKGVKEDCVKIQEMLYFLLDYFGDGGSKHDEYRIRINVIDKEGKDIRGDE